MPPIETDIGRALWSIGPLCRYAEDLPIVYGVFYTLFIPLLRLKFSGNCGQTVGRAGVPHRLWPLPPALHGLSEHLVHGESGRADASGAQKGNREMISIFRIRISSSLQAVRHFEAEFDIIGQKVDFPLAHHYLEIWGALGWDGTPAKVRMGMAHLNALFYLSYIFSLCSRGSPKS